MSSVVLIRGNRNRGRWLHAGAVFPIEAEDRTLPSVVPTTKVASLELWSGQDAQVQEETFDVRDIRYERGGAGDAVRGDGLQSLPPRVCE